MEKQELKKLFEEVLDERARIDCELHKEDHDFIAELRKERAARKEFWDRVKKTALGAAVALLVGKLLLFFFWLGDHTYEIWKALKEG